MKYIISLLFTFSLSIVSAADLGFSTSVTTLAVSNTRQTISASLINSFDFVIQNPASNVDSIFLGGSDVTTSGATQGIEIVPGATIALNSINNLASSKIFLVSSGTAVVVVIGRIVK